MNPGIYQIAAEAYHRDPCPTPSLSASIAKILLAKSPRHAWEAHVRLNPEFERVEKGIFDLGSAAHAVLLEGGAACEVICHDDWRSKAAQAARDAARYAGKVPILAKHYDEVAAMADVARDAVANCEELSTTLDQGKAEQSVLWRDYGNIWCRARLDWMSHDHRLVIDYKTTGASAEPDKWTRTMLGIGGEIQPAFYLRGLNMVTGTTADWVYLVQENYRPYACSLIRMSPAFMTVSMDKAQRAIQMWAECMKNDFWPGYAPGIVEIEPPLWMTDEEEMHT